ncbi:MAG: cytochrome c biogenesis protein CcsA [Planctomycetota bacterium]
MAWEEVLIVEPLANGFAVLLSVLYAIILTGERRALIGKARGADVIGIWILATTSLHLLALILRGVEIGACPVVSPWEAFSLLAWCVAVMQVLLVKVSGDRSTLIYSFSMVFVLQLGSTSFSLGLSEDVQQAVDSLTSVHAFSALLGVAGIAIAGIHGVLWLLLRHSIKKGRFGFLFQRLSSLEEISTLNRISVGIAAVALTLTLLTSFFLKPTFPELLNPEVVVTLVLWFLFGLLAIIPRSTRSVLATRAWLSCLGFCGVLFIIGWIAIYGFHAA